jgi:hypothetical protein
LCWGVRSDRVKTAFRVCSDRVKTAFRVCSECVTISKDAGMLGVAHMPTACPCWLPPAAPGAVQRVLYKGCCTKGARNKCTSSLSHMLTAPLQRLVLYDREHMVWETSQTMAGIPYGDCFTVETRWDFKPRGEGEGVDVTVHVCVPFTKRCLFKVRVGLRVEHAGGDGAALVGAGWCWKVLEGAGRCCAGWCWKVLEGAGRCCAGCALTAAGVSGRVTCCSGRVTCCSGRVTCCSGRVTCCSGTGRGACSTDVAGAGCSAAARLAAWHACSDRPTPLTPAPAGHYRVGLLQGVQP